MQSILDRGEKAILDQYDGYLTCRVNYNSGQFAQCDVVDACSINPAASIDDEFWLGPDMIQVHPERLGLTAADFLARYPVGKEFLVEYR